MNRFVMRPAANAVAWALLAVCAGVARSATAGAPATVPIAISDDFPIVTVKIAGVDVPLIFDSGDQSTLVLQRSIIDQVKAVPTGESSRQQFMKGKVVKSRTYRLPPIQIGNVVFTDVVAREDVHDPNYQPTDVGQKGYLGTGLLKSYAVVMSYRSRTMTLLPPSDRGSTDACRGTAVPFSPAWHGEPVTDAQTDFGRVTLWWDTGSPASALSRTFLQARQPHLSAGALTSRQLSLGRTDIGPWRFEVWDISLPGFNGFVGYDFFSQHTVCFDFPGKRMVIRQ